MKTLAALLCLYLLTCGVLSQDETTAQPAQPAQPETSSASPRLASADTAAAEPATTQPEASTEASPADNTSSEAEEIAPGPVPCPTCLFPIWYNAVNSEEDELCQEVNVEGVFQCLDTCIVVSADKPASYQIRQLTQIADIFFALTNHSCASDQCARMMGCFDNIVRFDNDGVATHAPYPTVYDYNCSESRLAAASSCLSANGAGCVSGDRLQTLLDVVNLGVRTACNNPRRCVMWGNIFEVKSGTECKEYYQEAAAYGPSTGLAQVSNPGLAFDPAQCRPDFIGSFTCPADATTVEIFSEFPEPKESVDVETIEMTVEDVAVNLTLSCEKCLYPVWERTVTTNGSHLCDDNFRAMVVACLNACKDKTVTQVQLHTETLVKIADLNKAFLNNGCSGFSGCSSSAYECTDKLANFYPMAAPHVTVNNFNCAPEALEETTQCYSNLCDPTTADLFNSFVNKGFSPVCESALRCLTYGNIYEYVPMSQLNSSFVPCANYRQAPANGWFVSAIGAVQPGLLLNTVNCQPDWPYNVECPSEIING